MNVEIVIDADTGDARRTGPCPSSIDLRPGKSRDLGAIDQEAELVAADNYAQRIRRLTVSVDWLHCAIGSPVHHLVHGRVIRSMVDQIFSVLPNQEVEIALAG